MDKESDYEHLIVHSQVKPELKKRVLTRGTILGVLGAAIWLFAGIMIPQGTLTDWGLPLFLLGLGFITFGLLPYRQLMKVDNNPSDLLLIENTQLSYAEAGVKKFTVPFSCIEKIGDLEGDSPYGIKIWLKNPLPDKLVVHDLKYDFADEIEKTRSKYQCDIFLPYFTESAFRKAEQFMNLAKKS
jgi:hypothetical protein